MTGQEPAEGRTCAIALPPVVAFLIWSLTVPANGWFELEAVAEATGWVALIATLAGRFFGILAERIAPTR
jgi:hypothetical protein